VVDVGPWSESARAFTGHEEFSPLESEISALTP
jgi:hypothetical protein